MKKWIAAGIIILLFLGGAGLAWYAWATVPNSVYAIDTPIDSSPADCPGDVRFAVIGDYGIAGQPEADVAALVDSWNIDGIFTVGDNNYPDGKADTIDANIGQYYQSYIAPYTGQYGPGAAENRFFPAPGNHDWRSGSLQPYLDYFTLPGNERYYDVTLNPVHFFVLDSDPREPDGRTANSSQAQWLQDKMAASTAPWKLALMHHAPYSSSAKRPPDQEMRWPFAEWGATAVITGHDHIYERLEAEGIVYFVNGLGGKDPYPIRRAAQESIVRYNEDYGAMLVNASPTCINFSFYNRQNQLIDSYTLTQ